jgi:hypothetical protein
VTEESGPTKQKKKTNMRTSLLIIYDDIKLYRRFCKEKKHVLFDVQVISSKEH